MAAVRYATDAVAIVDTRRGRRVGRRRPRRARGARRLARRAAVPLRRRPGRVLLVAVRRGGRLPLPADPARARDVLPDGAGPEGPRGERLHGAPRLLAVRDAGGRAAVLPALAARPRRRARGSAPAGGEPELPA